MHLQVVFSFQTVFSLLSKISIVLNGNDHSSFINLKVKYISFMYSWSLCIMYCMISLGCLTI